MISTPPLILKTKETQLLTIGSLWTKYTDYKVFWFWEWSLLTMKPLECRRHFLDGILVILHMFIFSWVFVNVLMLKDTENFYTGLISD